jgi:hypothetical protein
VLRNELASPGHWLIVTLKGREPNTDAIGAVITLRAIGVTETRYVRSGTSYISQSDMRQHFGLGSATTVESIDVLWPDGTHTTTTAVKADQIVRIEE